MNRNESAPLLTSHKQYSHSPIRHVYLGDGVALCGARNQVVTTYPAGEKWGDVLPGDQCKRCMERLGA